MASSLEEFYIVRLHHSPSPGFLGVTCISLPTTPLGAGATSEAPRGHQAVKKKVGTACLFWEEAGHERGDVAHRQSLSGEEYSWIEYSDFVAYSIGQADTLDAITVNICSITTGLANLHRKLFRSHWYIVVITNRPTITTTRGCYVHSRNPLRLTEPYPDGDNKETLLVLPRSDWHVLGGKSPKKSPSLLGDTARPLPLSCSAN